MVLQDLTIRWFSLHLLFFWSSLVILILSEWQVREDWESLFSLHSVDFYLPFHGHKTQKNAFVLFLRFLFFILNDFYVWFLPITLSCFVFTGLQILLKIYWEIFYFFNCQGHLWFLQQEVLFYFLAAFFSFAFVFFKEKMRHQQSLAWISFVNCCLSLSKIFYCTGFLLNRKW